MTQDMLDRLMRRLHRRYARRQMATWAAHVREASAQWNQNVSSVPLAIWQAAYVMKGVNRYGAGDTVRDL